MHRPAQFLIGDVALLLAAHATEHVRLCAKETAALQEPCRAPVWLEGNPPRFGVLRVRPRDADLVRVLQHMTVLNVQHRAKTKPLPHSPYLVTPENRYWGLRTFTMLVEDASTRRVASWRRFRAVHNSSETIRRSGTSFRPNGTARTYSDASYADAAKHDSRPDDPTC